MLGKGRVNVFEIELRSPLGLWEDEPEQEYSADFVIKWNPKERKISILRNKGSRSYTNKRHWDTHQTKIHPVHASTTRKQANTTQYISHGVSCAGSFAFNALNEAKTGKMKDAMELRNLVLAIASDVVSRAIVTRGVER